MKEIRERSLRLLMAKLELGWGLEDELAGTREILEALLAWFNVQKPTLQREALELLLKTLKVWFIYFIFHGHSSLYFRVACCPPQLQAICPEKTWGQTCILSEWKRFWLAHLTILVGVRALVLFEKVVVISQTYKFPHYFCLPYFESDIQFPRMYITLES